MNQRLKVMRWVPAMIEVSCPCGYRTEASDKHAGKSFTCPKCQLRGRVPTVSPAVPVPSFDCPKCSNTQTQSISVIHSGGTSVSTSRSGGLATGLLEDTPLYVGFARTKTAQQTDLARRFAPPITKVNTSVTPAVGWGMAGLFCLAIPIALLVGAATPIEATNSHPASGSAAALIAVTIVGGVVWIVAAFCYAIWIFVPWISQRQRDAEQAAARDRWLWERSYFCHRCGEVFVPAHLATDPKPGS